MERARNLVPRMLPLSEPELQHLPDPCDRSIKARIALGPQQGHKTFGYDVRKARHAQNVDRQDEGLACNQSRRDLDGSRGSFKHDSASPRRIRRTVTKVRLAV